MANFHTDNSYLVSDCPTVMNLLQLRSQRQPHQQAFTFLAEGETESVVMTYEALDRYSRAIAAQLQAQGLQGERALLLYPPGVDYLAAFFGCLYAGVVAVPAYPPRNQRNTSRILAVLEDAEAAIALSTTDIQANVRRLALFAHHPKMESLQWLTTDNLPPGRETQWQPPALDSETLAFLQYTSGSTGTPKGVMVTHGNLLHNAARTYEYMGHTPESIFVSWLPTYHDMGLIGGILQPLYGGFPCILMPPAAFLQRPYRWLAAISRYGGTTSGAPNFAYELCVQKIKPEQRETLDLSTWDVAFNGAEPIRQDTLDRFADYFAPCGFRRAAFYPCYGMAEATLMVSGTTKAEIPKVQWLQKDALAQNRVMSPVTTSMQGEQEIVSVVSCGVWLFDQQVVIANPETLKRCPDGEVGEIWVSGASVGKGYWNRPDATQETFQAYLADTGEGPFLRTGDLGFLSQGEIYITGRAKDLIIIRGRNLYPQDIERTVEQSHPALRVTGSAAFAVEVAGEECLVVVQELEFREKPDLDEVVQAIRQAIATEHEIQAYGVVLIKPGTIPKTSSGKIQRRACRSQFLAGTLATQKSSILKQIAPDIAPVRLQREQLLALPTDTQQEQLESYLQQQIAAGLQLPVAAMNWEQPLIALGLDSLRVFQLKHSIETDLGVEIAITDLFDEITVTQLATNLLNQVTETVAPVFSLQPCDAQEDYPLSDAQKQLWFFDRFQPGIPLYNIAGALHIQGKLEIRALEQSLNEIVRRQQSLRTYFQMVKGEARQAIASSVSISLPVIDLQDTEENELSQILATEAQTPLNLEVAPLMRVKLLQLSSTQFILTVVIHHIISDGWSMGIFLQELMAIYEALARGKTPVLKLLPIQYTDYAVWESQQPKSQAAVHLNYWKQRLGDQLPLLNLPTDYPHSTIATFKGARQKQVFSGELAIALKRLSQQQGVTLYMMLLAAFKVLLYRYTGQTDLLVGSPIAKRDRREINTLIGFFVNTVVLRTQLSGDLKFTDYLQTIRQTALAAYAHAATPFEQLVQHLQPKRELSHSPLFQVMFALQNMQILQQMPSGLIGHYEELDTGTAKFDLTLLMAETTGGLEATIEYNTALFKPERITRMLGHLQTLLESLVTHPGQPISQLPLLTAAEQQQFTIWNSTEVKYPQNVCLHTLIEAQVEKTPQATAVVLDESNLSLSYEELNTKANQLAHYLQQLGVQPDTLIGVCLERSAEMVIALLAILKAGGAYVPLEPTYPPQRLALMIEDAQLPVILTLQQWQDQLPATKAKVVCLDDNQIEATFCHNPISGVTSESLAYTIYTSGSTGTPKGVMNTHQGIVNRLLWMQQAYGITDKDCCLQKTPFSFDVSVWEFFLPLIVGAKLVIIPPHKHKEPRYLQEVIQRQEITLIHFVPSMLQVFLNTLSASVEGFSALKQVICSGEALPVTLQNAFFNYLPGVQLHNLYGPTEAAIDVTAWPCQPEEDQQTVPIGKAIANIKLYILDAYLKMLPVGVPGELHIGGVGLARGYINRRELTAERFVVNPFDQSQRLYKTGDLCRYREDGAIEFLGRLDNQVKIRGFRIELGEIESLLIQHPGVQQAVITAREDQTGNLQLVGYVVLNPELTPTVADLRLDLKKQLPEYMLPAVFVVLKSLPLNANGKVDRQKLPAPSCQERASTAVYAAPKTELEQAIIQIWQGCLQIEKIGIHDNFFDLGGHSLLLAQVHAQIMETLNLNISLVTLFEYPTIASLASYLTQQSQELLPLPALSSRAQKRKAAMKRNRK